MQCLRCKNTIKSTLAGSSIEYHYCIKCRAIFDHQPIILSYDDVEYDESWDDIIKDESEDDE